MKLVGVAEEVNPEDNSPIDHEQVDQAESTETAEVVDINQEDEEQSSSLKQDDSEHEDTGADELEMHETQEQIMARKLIEITVSSRRGTPVGERRKVSLDAMDRMRNHIIGSTRRLLTDEEADELILSTVLDFSFD